ncbi:glycosyltransferase family 2 protein [Microvirga aerilata]|uniref:Glycosyltransferase family 2 protein n=1 Tax=Microvirga aerilata TaxID=670292 RepID=A0A936ZC55_9HYPH|nr:glycosyltransferase family 2 protein [Microvirga aerilata]MBL0405070.1 glycosyltransferase family 2 protein [Microvirga aerilata]
MTERQPTPTPSDWAVPNHEQIELRPRSKRYALVIPVINEGERIRNQLRAIQDLRLPVDVVVADGGSTDGSVDTAFLRDVDVNALLIKRGSGRLSAQLRMAYAWALARGYEGIITVDGNGKDGVEAISRFITALDDGYDIIQGSRYKPGGEAVNTPFDRWIAGKFIHAPLISLGARFRFTDTTNGFRGYSAKALLDPRVAPFRDVFLNYNLLFYLSVRIPQLGYKACEVPVSRRYPRSGKTPTKIAGFRGRFAMFGELFEAVRGTFNP